MPRPPDWLKRRLVPAYNAVVHRGRDLRATLGAIARGDVSRCDCCGKLAAMRLRPRSIPPRLVELWGLSPRVAAALVRKETLDCSACGAKLRARRLARAVVDLLPIPGVRDLATWSRHPSRQGLRIAELNRIDGVHEAIAGMPGLASSDFHDNVEPGSYVAGVRHEDLSALTYADGSFDLVLTSETLEHVPDLGRALAEIRRVLVPGGYHAFTIPVIPRVRFTHLRPRDRPIAHPGGDWGYPVVTEFGADAVEVVRRAGFEVEVRFGPTTEDDLAQVYLARKPVGEGGP